MNEYLPKRNIEGHFEMRLDAVRLVKQAIQSYVDTLDTSVNLEFSSGNHLNDPEKETIRDEQKRGLTELLRGDHGSITTRANKPYVNAMGLNPDLMQQTNGYEVMLLQDKVVKPLGIRIDTEGYVQISIGDGWSSKETPEQKITMDHDAMKQMFMSNILHAIGLGDALFGMVEQPLVRCRANPSLRTHLVYGI